MITTSKLKIFYIFMDGFFWKESHDAYLNKDTLQMATSQAITYMLCHTNILSEYNLIKGMKPRPDLTQGIREDLIEDLMSAYLNYKKQTNIKHC